METLMHEGKPYACKIAIKDCKKGSQYHLLGDNGVSVATWRFPKGQSPFKEEVDKVVKDKGKGNIDKCVVVMSGGFNIESYTLSGIKIAETSLMAREMFVIFLGNHVFKATDNDTKAIEISSF